MCPAFDVEGRLPLAARRRCATLSFHIDYTLRPVFGAVEDLLCALDVEGRLPLQPSATPRPLTTFIMSSILCLARSGRFFDFSKLKFGRPAAFRGATPDLHIHHAFLIIAGAANGLGLAPASDIKSRPFSCGSAGRSPSSPHPPDSALCMTQRDSFNTSGLHIGHFYIPNWRSVCTLNPPYPPSRAWRNTWALFRFRS